MAATSATTRSIALFTTTALATAHRLATNQHVSRNPTAWTPAPRGIRRRPDKMVAEAHSYQGKVVWITGASSGLGAALAEEYARHGASLILSGRNQDELHRIKDLCLAAEGSHTHYILPFDLRNTDTLSDVAKEAENFFGCLDSVVLCGGVSSRGFANGSSWQIQNEVLQLNHMSSVAISLAVLPRMIQRGTGHIIHINSVQGKLGLPERAAYSASKHASIGFFDSLRAEIADSGVKVSSILPGYIRTNLSRNAITSSGELHGRTDLTTAAGMMPNDVARFIVSEAPRKDELILAPWKVKLAIGAYIQPSFGISTHFEER